jgi:hypothetical protein
MKYEASIKPVFVTERDTALRWSACSFELKYDCIDVGLWGRFTPYSWRRAALTAMAHQHGRQAAQQLAYHKPTSDAIYYYVNPLQNFDLQASRVGDTPIDEAETEALFASPATTRWVPKTQDVPKMREVIDAEVAARSSGETKQYAIFALRITSEVHEIWQSAHIVPDEEPTLEWFSPVMQKLLHAVLQEIRSNPSLPCLEDDEGNEDENRNEDDGYGLDNARKNADDKYIREVGDEGDEGSTMFACSSLQQHLR